MRKGLGIFIGVVLCGISAIAATPVGDVRWELIEVGGKRVKNAKAFVEFNESQNHISGSTGCNRMFGTYELAAGMFKLNGAGTTKMACLDNGSLETESAFLKALSKADKLVRRGKKLELFSNGSLVLKFRSAKTDSGQNDLTSKKWILKKIGEKPVELTKDLPFLNFDAEKKGAGGNSGCNVFGSNYETDGGSIKFRDIISTMMACEFEDRMTIERGFLDGLHNADRYKIDGNRLFLYKGDEIVLEFDGTEK